VNDTLAPRRERIKKLAGGHLMLKKLQFLFELPARLNQCVEMGALEQAVTYYVRAAKVLHHYREMDSFKGYVAVASPIAPGITPLYLNALFSRPVSFAQNLR
jgi:hypothetical protein